MITLRTRLGKIRTQARQRYLLIGSNRTPGLDPVAFTIARSDDPTRLHRRAKTRFADAEVRWDAGRHLWVATHPTFEVCMLVVDTAILTEVQP